MRRYFSLLCILALLVGCYNTDEQLINEPIPSKGRIFTASFEQNDTRTYVEEGNLLRWNAGDQVTIFDSNTLNQQYQFDGETGDNGGTFSKVSNSFGTGNDLNCHYALYPYASNVKITENGVISATLPAVQSYAEDSFGLGANTMVAVTKDVDETFLKFRNVGGYLKLQLYGENVTVKSIKLTGNNNEKIAGKATITPAYGQEPTIIMADDSTTSITLDCGEGVKIGTTAETATAFWIVVPPTTFEEGLTITVTEIDGESFTKSTSNAVVVERNIIKPMAALEVEIEKIPNNQIWYTSKDGQIVEPYKNADFGANIISNTYENGKGIITFDGEITSIGDYAFSTDNMLTSVKMPNSVMTIGVNAFYGTSLIDVIIPNSVTSVGINAFYDCSSLTSVTIGDSVTTIGNNAFNFCNSLTGVYIDNISAWCKINFGNICSNPLYYGKKLYLNGVIVTEITIPSNITEIKDYAFYRCSDLTCVNIPDSVTSIGGSAFHDCTSLTSITIPNSVTTIGGSAFYDCTSLTSVTIPDSITEIGDSAFRDCTSLTSITIPDSVTTIGGSAFYDCTSLTSVTIPDSITTIGGYAFYGCTSLTSITIPNSVTTIGGSAFYDCTSLTSITIPYSVTTIGVSAFYGCTSLKSVTIGDNVTSIEDETFCGCTSLINVIIGNSVTALGTLAFARCTSLTEITIPERVASFLPVVFLGCKSLKDIYCKPMTTPAIFYKEDLPDNGGLPIPLNAGMKIYVPRSSYNTYTSYTNYVSGGIYPDNWFMLKSYIEPYDF